MGHRSGGTAVATDQQSERHRLRPDEDVHLQPGGADRERRGKQRRLCVAGALQRRPQLCYQWAEPDHERSEEHTSEIQSLMRISYAVFCLKKTKNERK